MKLIYAIAALLSLWLPAGQAAAQSYPTQPVRILVGFTAGTAPDIVARVLAEKVAAGVSHFEVMMTEHGTQCFRIVRNGLEIADEAFEMTAYEDFVTEQVRAGKGIFGLYPPTNEQSLVDFAAWRKAKGR